MSSENETTAAAEALANLAASREEILAAVAKAKIAPRITKVPAPELGAGKFLLVRQLDGPNSRAFHQTLWVKDAAGKSMYDIDNKVAKFILGCVCDAEGNRLFAPDDLESVKLLPWSLQVRAFVEAQALNDPDIEEAAKN